MRALLIACTALGLTILPGCIHLPANVAAVVERSDPPGTNHFLPDPAPAQAAANAEPAPH